MAPKRQTRTASKPRPFLQRPPFSLRENIADNKGNRKYPLVAGDICTTFSEAKKLSEFERCCEDPAYFITNYCVVQHPKDGLVPFILYPFQEQKVIPGFLDNRMAITRKFRQGGFSTTAANLVLWKILFLLNQDILVVSKTDREAMEFLKIIYRAFDYLPAFLRTESVVNNEHIFQLDTGSRVLAYTPSAGVSYSCSLLIVDEAGRVEKMEEKWGDMFPVISTGGSCWVISTCNGVSGRGAWYYKKWMAAQNGESGFHPIDVAYNEHPEYDNEEYVETMRRELGDRKFRQEFMREFLGVSGGIFSDALISHYEAISKEPLMKRPCPKLPPGAQQKNLWVWEPPKPNKRYILSFDVGEGLGSNSANDSDEEDDYDFSTIQVIDEDSENQVAEYKNNGIRISDFAEVVGALGSAYNKATIVSSDRPLDIMVLQKLDEMGYENIYWGKPGKRMGIILSGGAREKINANMIDAIASKTAKVNSVRMINELRTIVNKNGRVDHMSGFHDDLSCAWAYGVHARKDILSSMPPLMAMTTQSYTEHLSPAPPPIFGEEMSSEEEEPLLPIAPNDQADIAKTWSDWGAVPKSKK